MQGELVRLIFTGICTFVGANIGHSHRPLTAVFANASHHNPEHHVSMIVSDDDYDVDTNVPGAMSLNSQLGKAYWVIPLGGKSIALEGVSPGVKREFVKPPLSKRAKREHRPTDLVEMESVEWIPSLGKSWPRMWPLLSTRRMQPHFYGVNADLSLVAASFELPPGKLASHWVSSDVWQFTPRSRTRRSFQTATAQEVRLDTKITANIIHFDVCDLETKRPCSYVRIRRRKPPESADDRMEVVIANVPDEDRLPGTIVYCGDCGVSECMLKDDPAPCTCVDHHFSHYYESLRNQIPDSPSLPHRVNAGPPIRPTALRVGGGNCPPSDYQSGG